MSLQSPQLSQEVLLPPQDINPIHMAVWCAKLFGMRSSIAHGMLLLTRCVTAAEATGAQMSVSRVLLEDCHQVVLLNVRSDFKGPMTRCAGACKTYPRAVKAQYRRPMYLPGRAVCNVRDADTEAGITGFAEQFSSGLEFAISAAAGGKDCITGCVLWGEQRPKL